jgi:hypothetical protein
MLHKWQHPDIWAAADKVLFDWSSTAPKEGGYDKVDFGIIYDDGEKYTGRYDLKHHSVEYPNLAKHVYDFVRFTAGKYKGALSQEEYERFKEQAHFKKLSPEFLKFLEKYEIGTYNIMEKLPEVKQAEKGWKDFFKGNRIQAMIDSTNYRIGARNVSEAEQKRLHESLKTDFKDLVEYQNLQSWGFASNLLTKDEAELLYRIYGGESPSAEKWDKLTLGEKVAATKLADELLGVKLKKHGYSARTIPKIAEDVPFLPQTSSEANTLAEKAVKKGADPEEVGRLLVEAELTPDPWLKGEKRIEARTKRAAALSSLKELAGEPDTFVEQTYITIEDPGKTTFSKGAVISPEAFAEENERVRKRGEKEASGWTGDKGEWPHDGNGANDEEFHLKSLPNEPVRRPKRKDGLEYFADSPEFLANTIEKTGWREQLDKEFQLAIARTR